MKFLFIHQNFPGQYKHLARRLAADPAHRVIFLTQEKQRTLPGVQKITYSPSRKPADSTHLYLRELETAVLNGQAVVRALQPLQKQGFVPDLIIGHNGWGEILYVKDLWPQTPLIGYFEFFYRLIGADVGFDTAEYPSNFDDGPRMRTRNSINLLGLAASDAAQTPTEWQKSRYPARYHDLFTVVHDGIDTRQVAPSPDAALTLSSGLTLTPRDEVITYVARNLEPYRGFHIFMRALPELLRRRPRAQVLIVGGDEVSYGRRLPPDETYRKRMLAELGENLDTARVHFLGKLPYERYLDVLRVSTVHVYLTYPFVLSWSMLEAMAAQCLVVASSTAPVTEVIEDGVNGLLTDFFDVPALVERVSNALAHREQLQALRATARRTIVQRYDLETVCLPGQKALLSTLAGRRL